MTTVLIATIALAGSADQGYRQGYGPPRTQQQKPAQVRVLNAVTDMDVLTFQVDDALWEHIPYGRRTNYVDVDEKRAETTLANFYGERIANEVEIQLQPGYPHTVIFTGNVQPTGQFKPIVLRDSTRGAPGRSNAQMVIVNAMSDQSEITLDMDGRKIAGVNSLKFGKTTHNIGLGQREYTFTVKTKDGAELFSTKYSVRGGTRYTAVVMGAPGTLGNRGPRLYFYKF